jgi:hypothetical protein
MATDAKTNARIFAILNSVGVKDRAHRLEVFRFICWRDNITSTKDLSPEELRVVADTLSYWEKQGRGILLDGVNMRYPYRVKTKEE